MNDIFLWKQLLEGEDYAYTYFYRTYVDVMYSYGLKFTPDSELVKDCIHDVFVKIYANRKKLGMTDNVRRYLLAALKNTLFNHFQKSVNTYNIDCVEPVFDLEYNAEEQIITDKEDQLQAKELDNMLNMLTFRQKEALYYRYNEGMKIGDICLLMQMNYQSVQNLLQRAIKKIRKSVERGEKVNLKLLKKI
ncbi:MAG: sigma-70 family RNA polymerase sigma factor [Dysgonamonadaceae bacterium]|jgi:RNA polymerase sigma factor (sigma-70 family)|nr:sigma-70 family RNA polymerase sigma factor [Dysgonamonadaceae bacterium]